MIRLGRVSVAHIGTRCNRVLRATRATTESAGWSACVFCSAPYYFSLFRSATISSATISNSSAASISQMPVRTSLIHGAMGRISATAGLYLCIRPRGGRHWSERVPPDEYGDPCSERTACGGNLNRLSPLRTVPLLTAAIIAFNPVLHESVLWVSGLSSFRHSLCCWRSGHPFARPNVGTGGGLLRIAVSW